MQKTLIKGGLLVTGDGTNRADILLSVTGDVERIAPTIAAPRGTDIVNVKGLLLFPLLIDCHVHFREPGLEHKATMESEAKAALAGGIGTVCEMPNTMPPTTTIAALADKVRRASLVEGCTMKFFFGCTEPAHLQTLRDLWTGTSMELRRLKHHCCGVKIYLDHSTGNQGIPQELMEDVFRTCGELKIPLVAHCEDAKTNGATGDERQATSDIATHSLLRPPESEAAAIGHAIALAGEFKAPLHIAHVSTKQGTDLVRGAKAQNIAVTCEVAPHHLFLTTDDYASLGTLAKVNPPVRSREHRDALWAALADGTIDCIATDHAPHTLAEKKTGDPLQAPSGIPAIELSLPLLFSVAAKHWPHPHFPPPAPFPSLTMQDILRLCFENPNRIFSLRAPAIDKGSPARIAIVNPTMEWTVTPAALVSKCGWTPYEAWGLTGRVVRTFA